MANDNDDKNDTSWLLLVGIGSLGVLLGVATGLASADGTTKSLLGAVLGFAGGTLFAGAKVKGKEGSWFSPRSAGAALLALCFPLLVGLIGGMWFRETDPANWVADPCPVDCASTGTAAAATPSNGDKASTPGRTGPSLHGLTREKCQGIRARLDRDQYGGEGGRVQAISDLREVMDAHACTTVP